MYGFVSSSCSDLLDVTLAQGDTQSVKAWVCVLDYAAPCMSSDAPVGLQPNSAVLDVQLLQPTTRPGHGGHTDITNLK